MLSVQIISDLSCRINKYLFIVKLPPCRFWNLLRFFLSFRNVQFVPNWGKLLTLDQNIGDCPGGTTLYTRRDPCGAVPQISMLFVQYEFPIRTLNVLFVRKFFIYLYIFLLICEARSIFSTPSYGRIINNIDD